jgi:hypothetical protein
MLLATQDAKSLLWDLERKLTILHADEAYALRWLERAARHLGSYTKNHDAYFKSEDAK